jgi:hypothetical protein
VIIIEAAIIGRLGEFAQDLVDESQQMTIGGGFSIYLDEFLRTLIEDVETHRRRHQSEKGARKVWLGGGDGLNLRICAPFR